MKNILSILIFIIPILITSQEGVSINNTGIAPNVNSILDVSSDDKGILIPRITTLARTSLGGAIGLAENGMLIYDKDLLVFYFWDGTQWVLVGNGVGSDNQNLTGATLTGTSLQIDIQNGNSTTVDLSSLQDGVNDADADATNEIELPTGGTSGQILSTDGSGSYSWVNDEVGTDNQDLTLTGNVLSLTNDGSTVDLSIFKDHDWYEVGGTTQPNAITDNIFTQGNVGIGTIAPQQRLHINDGVTLIQNSDGNNGLLQFDADGAGSTSISDFASISGLNGGLSLSGLASAISAPHAFINNSGNLGVGTITPTERLDVQGSVKIVDGTEGAGKVLTSNANGVGSWQTPSTSLLLPVVYPNGTSAPTSTFTATGVHNLAKFTAPSSGLYMVCVSVTVNILGGQYGDLSTFSSNSQTFVRLTGGGSSANEEHLSEDATKQISINYLYNLTSGNVVNFDVGQQNATSFGYSGLEMRVVKF